MDDTGGKTPTFKKTDEKHTHTNVKAVTSVQLDVYFPAAMYLLLLLLFFWKKKSYISQRRNFLKTNDVTQTRKQKTFRRISGFFFFCDFAAFLSY